MQNFVGKTKCIVGYMKVADILSLMPDEDKNDDAMTSRENDLFNETFITGHVTPLINT